MASGVSAARKPKRQRVETKALRVLICAATSLARSGLARLVESQSSLQFSGTVASLDELQQAIAEHDPDVLILHLASQSLELRAEYLVSLGIPVVLLADEVNMAYSASILAGGVHAILVGDSTGAELAAAVHAAAAGLLCLSGDLSDLARQGLLVHLHDEVDPDSHDDVSLPGELPEQLTLREREVLEMIVEGLTNKEIAAELSISAHTVKFHISSIMGKLNASTRTEAAAIGLRHGLVTI
jgi:DNA-binding NarL/FixJ family response regulator